MKGIVLAGGTSLDLPSVFLRCPWTGGTQASRQARPPRSGVVSNTHPKGENKRYNGDNRLSTICALELMQTCLEYFNKNVTNADSSIEPEYYLKKINGISEGETVLLSSIVFMELNKYLITVLCKRS